MDRMEKNVNKHLGEKDREKDSDYETEQEVRIMLDEYDLRADEKEDSISPPKLEEVISPLFIQWTPPVSATGLRQC